MVYSLSFLEVKPCCKSRLSARNAVSFVKHPYVPSLVKMAPKCLNPGSAVVKYCNYEAADNRRNCLYVWISREFSQITDTLNLFRDMKTFHENIGSGNVSTVTKMSYMFYDATAFNQESGTLGCVKFNRHARNVFIATAFNKVTGSCNVANVTDMRYMFCGTKAFNQSIPSWNVA
jgi:hypothetical protein